MAPPLPYSAAMRIAGGELRGRRLKVPSGQQVRPTQDRVREALFSMLMGRLAGCRFADCFGGSGAVGIEAWSRGAADVTWIEADRRVARMLKENVAALCPGIGTVVCDDVLRWVKRCRGPFDIVFADPPYRRDDPGSRLAELMQGLLLAQAITPDGVFVAEQAVDAPAPAPGGWKLDRERIYGQTVVRIYVLGDESLSLLKE